MKLNETLLTVIFKDGETLNGSTNLILYNNLQKSFDKYCISKKVKESLGSFISNFPSNIDTLPNDEVKESRLEFFYKSIEFNTNLFF